MSTTLPRRLAASLTLLGLLGLSACGSEQPQSGSGDSTASGTSQDSGADAGADSGAAAPEADIDTSSSTDVVVNKARPLDPEDYAPEPLEDIEGQQLREDAAGAAQQMLSDMRDEGITVSITSAYRPYDEQVTTYQHWVDVNGQETADTISARPGHSEHQTGLVMDIADGSGCDLQECFADTAAAQCASCRRATSTRAVSRCTTSGCGYKSRAEQHVQETAVATGSDRDEWRADRHVPTGCTSWRCTGPSTNVILPVLSVRQRCPTTAQSTCSKCYTGQS